MPKVSVIMGIYNCAPTLQEALDSLYAQTYQDFEIILCDDGSSDETYAIAQRNADEHPNIVLLKNERNLKLNATLNRCLRHAKGEYIARMDGDDISMPTRFEKEVRFLDAHPEFALVSCPMIMFDESGDWEKLKVIERPTIKDFATHTPFFCHAACMMRKTVFDEVGGYTEDKRFLRVEDCNLWFKVYAAGHSGANLTEPLYKMRDDRNATQRRTLSARKNGIYVMYNGFRQLHMPWYMYYYVLRNAAIETAKCLMPTSVYEYFHKRKQRCNA